MKTQRSLLGVSIGAALVTLGLSQSAEAQNFHGIGVVKSCGSDTLCVGSTTECVASAVHFDTAGDALLYTEAYDRIDPLGSDIRVPAVGNLPIYAVTGNAVATMDGGQLTFPVLVGPPDSVYLDPDTGLQLPGAPEPGILQVIQNEYVIQSEDPNPLLTQTIFTFFDECDSGAGDCPDPTFPIVTPAAASLVISTPVIDVEQTADLDPASVCAGVETEVTYTYTVTNTGDVDLEGLVFTDSNPDCTPAYASGDNDGDNELDLSETWLYECTVILTEGTTNTAAVTSTAVGAADGCAASDEATFTITTTACPEDIDGNCVIGFGDLLLVLAAWGPCDDCPADIDGNGVVGPLDLDMLHAAWGACH